MRAADEAQRAATLMVPVAEVVRVARDGALTAKLKGTWQDFACNVAIAYVWMLLRSRTDLLLLAL
jgi:hypothetical protein